MREIIFSTETGSDMPKDMAEKYGVRIVPMHLSMGGEDYEDGSFPVDRVYDYYKETKKVPTTSTTNVGEYIDLFNGIRAEHPDCVIFHFAYSAAVSSSYQNAAIAVEDFDDVYLIDTTKVTGGIVFLILRAYEMVHQRGDTLTDYQAFADEIQDMTAKMACSFIPGNLEYLKAGGRVSNAAYLGATLLQLKPLIDVDSGGYLVASKKYRGSMIRIVESYVREFVTLHNLDRSRICLLYSKGASQEVLDKMKECAEAMGFRECIYIQTGCVISCHSGPGTIGLAGISA
ncbi:MAG: DegV family EDD domain-containing protein [Clostridiales bacterium]|nr:DegV family EDD domain-containing protein [Clostridiales bacterium]